ncbi:MAG: hypothetical protein PHX24_12240 [Acidithiobacillus sp.]|nr:hypothetical protein [Acidithiobacillus sp.]
MTNEEQIYRKKHFALFMFYLKNMIWLTVTPWLVLSFFVIVALFFSNSGITSLFQSAGLHAHEARRIMLWVVISGMLLAMVWVLWCILDALLGLSGRQVQKIIDETRLEARLEAWATQKTAPLRSALGWFTDKYPHSTDVLMVVLIVLSVAALADIVSVPLSHSHNKEIPLAPISIVVSPYSRVLMEVPNKPVGKHSRPMPATHTVSGQAMVTQTGPHTYQVRMIPS